MNIIIDKTRTYQTFDGFGASGAWLSQVVGDWTHIDSDSGLPVRDRIAQLLYSREEGIGLRIYRYNIGAGSKHSDKGTYSQQPRRTESFDEGEGQYDWSRDAAAVYMMKKAVAEGAEEVIFFVNSPIERLTKNGMAHSSEHSFFRENLSRKNYKAFADYCLDVSAHFIAEGVPIKYLSPVNEPLWVWNGGQEGCHYSPESVRKVFHVFANEMDKRDDIGDLKLAGAEYGDLRYFNKTYTRQLLKDSNVRKYLDSVDVHSYCTQLPLPVISRFINNRVGFVRRFRKWMDRHYPDVPVKISEWTHMQGGRDNGMTSALEMAKIIYEDISILHVTSWQHWIAVSEVDYCDGLIYVNLDDKTFETTKRLYATGNFSKYIPCGSKLIYSRCEDEELQVLSFNGEGQTVVIVINQANKEKEISIDTSGKDAKMYVTDVFYDLERKDITNPGKIQISPRSVNTVIYFD